MASYNIEIKRSAAKEIRQLPASVRRAVVVVITGLAREPRPSGCKKLRGYLDTYRIRKGEYRVVYEITDRKLLVMVVKVGHRQRVYDL